MNSVHPSILATLQINVLNVTVGIQVHASDVDWSITELQIFRNQIIRKRKFTEKKPKNCAHRSTRIDKTSDKSTEKKYSQKIYTPMK